MKGDIYAINCAACLSSQMIDGGDLKYYKINKYDNLYKTHCPSCKQIMLVPAFTGFIKLVHCAPQKQPVNEESESDDETDPELQSALNSARLRKKKQPVDEESESDDDDDWQLVAQTVFKWGEKGVTGVTTNLVEIHEGI